MAESPNSLKWVNLNWMNSSRSRNFLDQTFIQKDFDEEMNWVEKDLAEVLDTHIKIFKVT